MYSLIEGTIIFIVAGSTILGAIRLITQYDLRRNGHVPFSKRVHEVRNDNEVARLQTESAQYNATKELIELKHQAALEYMKDEEGKRQLLGLPSGKQQEEATYDFNGKQTHDSLGRQFPR